MAEVYDNSFKLKVTNHMTGEISEIEIKNPDQAVNTLQDLLASKRALDTAITNLKTYIDVEMGLDDKVQLGNYMVERVQRTSRVWTKEGLKAIGFDEDAIAVVSSISMSAARSLVDEAIERGEIAPDSKKVLNESADLKNTAPFLTFKQVK